MIGEGQAGEGGMYQDDFTTPDTIYAPAGGDLMLGLPPLLLVMLMLLVAAVAALAWWLGRNSVRGNTGDEAAPAEIHRAILSASSAAMAASSNELKSRAQALRDLIHELLGPVLDVAKGITPPLKGLDEALKGEKKVEAKAAAPVPAPAPPAAPSTPACSCGKPEACTCRSGPAAGPVTVNQVYIGGVPVAPAPGCGCIGSHKPDCTHTAAAPKPDPQPAPKPETQAMTGPEQVEALARAVRQFHDHWLDGPARIRELKAARAALSRRPTTPRTRSHGPRH
jgi:hypothetical protein